MTQPSKRVEEIVERLCRNDNHMSGDSGESNKYAIKKISLKKALTQLEQQAVEERDREMVEMIKQLKSKDADSALLGDWTPVMKREAKGLTQGVYQNLLEQLETKV